MNGREPCEACDRRNTEKVGPYSYECHDCGHEWTDDEAREEHREDERGDRGRLYIFD